MFIVKTGNSLDVTYLKRTGNGYMGYWHFIKDFAEDFNPEFPPEIIEKLKERVNQRKNIMDILSGEKEFRENYSDYFQGDYKQYDFQKRAVRFITEQKKVLLADDVGLGKTVVTITTILDLIEKSKALKFLIVVPASLRLQWLGEIRKFINRDMFPDLKVIVQRQGKKDRRIKYKYFEDEDSPVVMILSYAAMREDMKEIEKLSIDMVILDEATKIKVRTTKTNKCVRKLFKNTEYKLALTATPLENGLEDLYCICEWIDYRRFRIKGYFYHRYCVMREKKIWRGRGTYIVVREIERYKNLIDAKQKLAGLYIRRTIGDMSLELPSIVNQNITLPMSKDQVRAYKEVKGETYGEATKIDLFGQLTILQEVCDSPELIDKPGQGNKINEFKRLLSEDFRYQKVIAITRFKKFAKLIYKELKKKFDMKMITGDVDQKKRTLIIDNFTSGEGQKIIIGTTAIEEGLNLQAGSVLINLDLPWNPAKLRQRLGRIYRLGSEHDTIRMINLIMEDTIEERVLEVLYEKGELFEQIFHNDEAVRIKNLLEMDKDIIKEMI
jgi:SNF2 family DNA or RNA helicase